MKTFTAFFTCLVWITLLLRFYLGAQLAVAEGQSALLGVIASLGYFTVLTTSLVGVALLANGIARFPLQRFFTSPLVNTGLAASVILVALVYSLMLRHLWQPEGMRLLVDIFLHDVIPPLFVLHWWLRTPAAALTYSRGIVTVLYPLVYLAVILLIGLAIGQFPYPFMDANQLSWARVVFNLSAMLLVYLSLVQLLVFAKRKASR